jgi:hypothetical protein
MNKIKVIYDVVRKMKDTNSIKGTAKVEGLKDEQKIIDLNSVFERNNQSHQVKGKTTIEVDCDGKKMKMENSIDFQKEGCCGHHHFHHMHHGPHAVGLKGGLNRITTILGIVSSAKLDEKEDGSVILSLESADIPEEVKSGIHEILKQGQEHHKHMEGSHQHHMFMKGFHGTENVDFTLNIFINKDSKIDKVKVDVKGEKEDEKNEKHQMKLAAELSLEW